MNPIERLEPDPMTRSPRAYIANAMAHGMTRAQAKAHYDEMQDAEWWGNEKYSLICRRNLTEHGFDLGWTLAHLSIHRRDRAPCDDWREFQEIKTAVLGAEAEAIQLYPAESRLVDGANEFHLWSLFDAEGQPVQWPLGFNEGRVRTNKPGPGAVQRPLEEQQT